MRAGTIARVGPCVALVLSAFTLTAWADADEVQKAIDRGDCAQAGAAINEGIDRNQPEAYFGAGYLYASTGCVAEDFPRAARYYQRAIELGSKDARNMLGFMHGMGVGVPQDYGVAYHWYTFPIGDGAVKPHFDRSREIGYGYARTVQLMAANRVSYPHGFNGREQGTLYVTFHTATGTLTYASHGRDGERNPRRLSQPSPFMLAIDRAYEEALRFVPKPDDMAEEDLEFESPWEFQLR